MIERLNYNLTKIAFTLALTVALLAPTTIFAAATAADLCLDNCDTSIPTDELGETITNLGDSDAGETTPSPGNPCGACIID